MRHPVTVVLFMVCVVAVITGMTASGVTGWLGVQPDTGVSDQVNQGEEELKDYSASREAGDTSFIGATISGVDKTLASLVIILSLADMLINVGVPPWAAVMVSSPAVWALGLFIIYMFTGRSEVRPR